MYLACGVHLGCVPLGLVLEVDLVPLELGLGFSECELSLSRHMLSVNILASEMYFEVSYPVREGADLWNQCQSDLLGTIRIPTYLRRVKCDSLRHA